MTSLASRILNLAFYQLGWFCCLLGAARGYPLAGAGVALLLVGVHLLLSDARGKEVQLLLLSGLFGLLVDSLQQGFDLLRFRGDGVLFGLPPWIVVVWIQFATLFRFALAWLRGRNLLAAGLGLVGGPLAYWAGVRLGAAEFGASPVQSLVVLGLVWSIAMPLLLQLSRTLNPQDGRYRTLSGVFAREARKS